MTETVTFTHDYEAPVADVWAVATDFDSFARAMKGVASFEGMPTAGRLQQGQVLDVKVRLFGWMPPMDYHMHVVECSDADHSFLSEESGGAVKRWAHRLTVTPIAGGARLTDRIKIDAGWMTPLMCRWARFVYSRRHAPRVQMLAERG